MQGFSTTPSIVSFNPDGKVVGISAQVAMGKNFKNTVYDAKRMIGMNYNSSEVQSDAAHWPFTIKADKDNRVQI